MGNKREQTFNEGERISIPVGAIEFNVGSNTIWIQSPQGGTTLRIKCSGKINVDSCSTSPISHSDIIVDGDIDFCLSEDTINQNHE